MKTYQQIFTLPFNNYKKKLFKQEIIKKTEYTFISQA